MDAGGRSETVSDRKKQAIEVVTMNDERSSAGLSRKKVALARETHVGNDGIATCSLMECGTGC